MLTDSSMIVFFSFLVLFVLLLLFAGFWFAIWANRQGEGKSPYTGTPLRRATQLSYYSAEKVLQFLYNTHQYDNRIFKLRKAAFCRETGRIFQDCITWYDVVKVDWNFLANRYPGNYVSWGSLSYAQQENIRLSHDSLEGYQTEFSSPNPIPRAIEPEYANSVPGPLYVDLETKILLGWKCVPDTELEVLIVQKPTKIY